MSNILPFHPQLSRPKEKPLGRVKIDRTHPIGRSSIFCMLFNELYDVPKDIAEKGTQLATGTDIVWELLRGEIFLNGAGVSTSIDTNRSDLTTGLSECSIEFFTTVVNLTNTRYVCLNGSNANGISIGAQQTSAEIFEVAFRGGGTTDQIASSAQTITSAIHVCATWKTNTRPDMYINGELDNATRSGSTVTSNLDAGNRDLFLFSTTTGSANYQGRMLYFRMYNKKLSERAVKSLYNDPYQYIIGLDHAPQMSVVAAEVTGVFKGLTLLGVGR